MISKITEILKILYNYLDTLSLLQESAILHILIFFLLILIIINILSALFVNEIIQYFNIEKNFPSLSIFFKLRSQFQRYYLMLNVSLLIIVCMGAIGINILVLIVT